MDDLHFRLRTRQVKHPVLERAMAVAIRPREQTINRSMCSCPTVKSEAGRGSTFYLSRMALPLAYRRFPGICVPRGV